MRITGRFGAILRFPKGQVSLRCQRKEQGKINAAERFLFCDIIFYRLFFPLPFKLCWIVRLHFFIITCLRIYTVSSQGVFIRGIDTTFPQWMVIGVYGKARSVEFGEWLRLRWDYCTLAFAASSSLRYQYFSFSVTTVHAHNTEIRRPQIGYFFF